MKAFLASLLLLTSTAAFAQAPNPPSHFLECEGIASIGGIGGWGNVPGTPSSDQLAAAKVVSVDAWTLQGDPVALVWYDNGSARIVDSSGQLLHVVTTGDRPTLTTTWTSERGTEIVTTPIPGTTRGSIEGAQERHDMIVSIAQAKWPKVE